MNPHLIMNYESACSLSHKPGQQCMSVPITEKIIAAYPELRTRLDTAKSTVEELNILLRPEVIKLLGEDIVLEELNNFKPVGPTDTTLLNNFQENNVLRSLARFDPKFIPITVQLMDFPEPHYQFSRALVDFEALHGDDIRSGRKTTFGCVLNTLRSDGDIRVVGHWVAMFGDFRGCYPSSNSTSTGEGHPNRPPTIEYFNSSGRGAPRKVMAWMEMLAAKFGGIAVNADSRMHQQSETECGAYALFYITARLLGKRLGYKAIRDTSLPDGVPIKLVAPKKPSGPIIADDRATTLRRMLMNEKKKVRDPTDFLGANLLV